MKSSEQIPVWGYWLIGSVLALILGFFIHSSGAIPHIVAAALPLIVVIALATIYMLPTIIATRSPRVTAILVANLVFGWTIIGWIIVLIWALAESGSLNKNPTP